MAFKGCGYKESCSSKWQEQSEFKFLQVNEKLLLSRLDFTQKNPLSSFNGFCSP